MVQYKVPLSNAAENDLRNIAEYITLQYFAPIAAAKKVRHLKETIVNRLSFMPQKYRLVDNDVWASIGLRRMNVENYIVFFIVNPKKNIVNVARIIHGKRDWEHVLSEET